MYIIYLRLYSDNDHIFYYLYIFILMIFIYFRKYVYAYVRIFSFNLFDMIIGKMIIYIYYTHIYL